MVSLESDIENVEVGRSDVTAYLREDSQAVAEACGAVAVCGADSFVILPAPRSGGTVR